MANTAANVLFGKPAAAGGLLIAPAATALPTDTDTAPNVAFVGAGYVSSDGVTESNGDSTTKITAWGGDIVRVVRSSYDLMYKFMLIETADVPLKLYYGAANVTTASGLTTVQVNGTESPYQEFIIEMLDPNGKKMRIVIPAGKLEARDDVVYKQDDAIKYGVTINCSPDSSGNKAYKYIK